MKTAHIMRAAALLAAAAAASIILFAASKPKSLSSYDAQVKPLLAQMTLEEKIGQMTQPEQSALVDQADIEKYFVGSLLSGGDSDPSDGNGLQPWTNLYDRLQEHTAKTRLKIPILYGIDAVHGHNNVLGAVIFPHNVGLGCTRNPALIEKVERITAEEIRATGIQWTFAPGVMTPQDIRWGRTYEGFSEDPAVVRELAGPAVRGLQGSSLADPLSVLACAKHYVGDGGTAWGSTRTGLDQGDMRVDEATLRKVHLQGYYAAIEAGVGTIMPSYSSWNGVKCSANKRLLTDILKNEMGFEGFLISDYNAVDQLSHDFKEAVQLSINAGMDMVMEPTRYREYYDALKALVNEGKVPMSRIDDAVTRILRVKFAMGMMEKGRSQMADRKLWKSFGSPEHRAVARQAVRESLVLLKNDGKTLPLAKNAARIHVSGKSADNVGNQCGGWTIDWQGRSGTATEGGTSILAAMRATGAHITYSAGGSGAEGATVGVVVIGERPYAEMMGDRANLAVGPEDIAAVAAVKRSGIPVVVVVVSGRPVVLGSVLDQANAVMAAWLPGTEGAGVADVLFGDYNPTGKLSYAWPRSMDQLKSDPLFALGYGLKY